VVGQREMRVLGVLVCWFDGVSNEFELVRYRYEDECMHDARC
jgi:hypothetical protein